MPERTHRINIKPPEMINEPTLVGRNPSEEQTIPSARQEVAYQKTEVTEIDYSELVAGEAHNDQPLDIPVEIAAPEDEPGHGTDFDRARSTLYQQLLQAYRMEDRPEAKRSDAQRFSLVLKQLEQLTTNSDLRADQADALHAFLSDVSSNRINPPLGAAHLENLKLAVKIMTGHSKKIFDRMNTPEQRLAWIHFAYATLRNPRVSFAEKEFTAKEVEKVLLDAQKGNGAEGIRIWLNDAPDIPAAYNWLTVAVNKTKQVVGNPIEIPKTKYSFLKEDEEQPPKRKVGDLVLRRKKSGTQQVPAAEMDRMAKEDAAAEGTIYSDKAPESFDAELAQNSDVESILDTEHTESHPLATAKQQTREEPTVPLRTRKTQTPSTHAREITPWGRVAQLIPLTAAWKERRDVAAREGWQRALPNTLKAIYEELGDNSSDRLENTYQLFRQERLSWRNFQLADEKGRREMLVDLRNRRALRKQNRKKAA